MSLAGATAPVEASPLPHFSRGRRQWRRPVGIGYFLRTPASLFKVTDERRTGGFRRRCGRGNASTAMSLAVAEKDRRVEAAPTVEIPVTCYQIIGVSEKAEKDEIVKAIKELKEAEIEDGYTEEVSTSRQNLLTDIRDKLLFEREYAGDIKERIPPRSSLQIPATWVPAALSLLQEVEEERMVLDIGRQIMKRPDAKPYVHDIVLAMALAECGIAKASFEKRKVSFGFEALARAQHLLRSRASLWKIPLLAQIEESLQELVPDCTLEVLSMQKTPENAERRRGAIAALRELLRQGLDGDSSCKVNDWPCFLHKAMNKLMAVEIVELLSWDTLAINRKNKKSLDAQSQRVVVDSNCFYIAMAAHLAYGFTMRQCDMISKAKNICECLSASDNMDLKFEESFCLFLLGQESGTATFEKLQQLQISGASSTSRNYGLVKAKEGNEKDTNQSLELWLKDVILSLFPDTRDCSSSLANFYGAPRRVMSTFKPNVRINRTILSPSAQPSGEQSQRSLSTKQLGDAVKQLAPVTTELESSCNKSSSSNGVSTGPPKRDVYHTNSGEFPGLTTGMRGKVVQGAIYGLSLLAIFKLLNFQFGNAGLTKKLIHHMKMNANTAATSIRDSSHSRAAPALITYDVSNKLEKLSRFLGLSNIRVPLIKKSGVYQIVPDNIASRNKDITLHGQKMSVEEAEILIRQWQDIKAEALGPDHQIDSLEEILADGMLLKWQELAKSARAQSCFWRFVLLNVSVSRADLSYDEAGRVTAEIEAVLEEAAEIVDESQPKKPSYYSTYEVQYVLKKQQNKSWRICEGSIREMT